MQYSYLYALFLCRRHCPVTSHVHLLTRPNISAHSLSISTRVIQKALICARSLFSLSPPSVRFSPRYSVHPQGGMRAIRRDVIGLAATFLCVHFIPLSLLLSPIGQPYAAALVLRLQPCFQLSSVNYLLH